MSNNQLYPWSDGRQSDPDNWKIGMRMATGFLPSNFGCGWITDPMQWEDDIIAGGVVEAIGFTASQFPFIAFLQNLSPQQAYAQDFAQIRTSNTSNINRGLTGAGGVGMYNSKPSEIRYNLPQAASWQIPFQQATIGCPTDHLQTGPAGPKQNPFSKGF
ncbi:hypothetical protein CVS40_0750 [Lucilia cuprina]|nr:hypothetical protein CVS40_0750 [Lucilia cuprina]